ncbi:MAG: hypothetical protein IJ480_11705 [Clostridia bacterium]|nr:hypothetical protein [Clostridia bacterium]
MKKILLPVLAVLAAALTVCTAAHFLFTSAEIVETGYDFSLENPDVARTVLEHIGGIIKNSPSKLTEADAADALITGPFRMYTMNNEGTVLTQNEASYYIVFTAGYTGRVTLHVQDGMIRSSGSGGLTARYTDVEKIPHILISNDFYGEFMTTSEGTELFREIVAHREDYPDIKRIPDIRARAIIRRYGKQLLQSAPAPQTLSYTALSAYADT